MYFIFDVVETRMNELLAIILIVLVCCIMFFAWLISMATCPDKMVNFISGNSARSSSSSPPESKETLKSETKIVTKVAKRNFPITSESRSNSKKLSIVPETDEQLTVTSISQCIRQPLNHTDDRADIRYVQLA